MIVPLFRGVLPQLATGMSLLVEQRSPSGLWYGDAWVSSKAIRSLGSYNSLVEGTQDFEIILRNPSGGAVLGDRPEATVRITDNDKGLQFEFGSYSVAEDAGTVLVGVLRGDDGASPRAAACRRAIDSCSLRKTLLSRDRRAAS